MMEKEKSIGDCNYVHSKRKRFSSHTGLHKQVPVVENLQCHAAHDHPLPVPALCSAHRLGWALTWRGEESYDLSH